MRQCNRGVAVTPSERVLRVLLWLHPQTPGVGKRWGVGGSFLCCFHRHAPLSLDGCRVSRWCCGVGRSVCAVQSDPSWLERGTGFGCGPTAHAAATGAGHSVSWAWGFWLVAHVAAAGGCRVLLYGNLMETLPAELCAMFPNAEVLALSRNRLRTLPRELGQMQRLRT